MAENECEKGILLKSFGICPRFLSVGACFFFFFLYFQLSVLFVTYQLLGVGAVHRKAARTGGAD
jgi:hypothetical protein